MKDDGGAMSADAYVEDGLLYVAYGDFNQNKQCRCKMVNRK